MASYESGADRIYSMSYYRLEKYIDNLEVTLGMIEDDIEAAQTDAARDKLREERDELRKELAVARDAFAKMNGDFYW